MSARTMTLALILGGAALVSAAPLPKPPAGAPGAGNAGAAPPTAGGGSVTGGGASAPLSPEQIKALDENMRQAETIVLDMESIAKGGVDGTGCPPSFTVREYMQDLRSRGSSKETGDDILDSDATHKEDSGAKIEWQFYFLCQALATRNPGACAEASAVTPKTLNREVSYKSGLQDPNAMSTEQALAMEQSQSYQGKCTISYYQERVRAAYTAKAPNFMDVCREGVSRLTEVKDAASGESVCRALRDYSGDPEPFVAAMQAGVAHPLKREFVLGALREMTVAPGTCASLPREYYRRLCREQEEYRQALAAKSAAPCRGGICRVLMGDGLIACDSYSKKFRAAACTQHYAAEFAAGRARTFKSYADQIEKTLSASDSGLGDPKAMKEFNARIDRLYDLRDRFDRAADKINPGAARKTPGAAKKGA